jgi:hypothetical protein
VRSSVSSPDARIQWRRCPIDLTHEVGCGHLPAGDQRARSGAAGGRCVSQGPAPEPAACHGNDSDRGGSGASGTAWSHRAAGCARIAWTRWDARCERRTGRDRPSGQDRSRRSGRQVRASRTYGSTGRERDSGATGFDRTHRTSWTLGAGWSDRPSGSDRASVPFGVPLGTGVRPPTRARGHRPARHRLRGDMNHPLSLAGSTCHDQPRVEARPRRSTPCP